MALPAYDELVGSNPPREGSNPPREGNLPSYDDLMAETPDYSDSDSPETDKALDETSMWEQAMKVAKAASPLNLINEYNKFVIGGLREGGLGGVEQKFKEIAATPSPPWLQKYEEPARQFLNQRAIPEIPSSWVGESNAAAINTLTGIATPANAIIAAGMVAQPELTPYLLPTMMAPMVPGVIEGGKKLLKGEITPAEGGKLAGEVALLGLPFAHAAAVKAFEPPYPPPPPPPRGKPGKPHPQLKEITPTEFIQKYGEAPEDLTGTREVPGAPPTAVAGEEKYMPKTGLSAAEEKTVADLTAQYQRGDITADQYRQEASKALQVGIEPTVRVNGYDYKFDSDPSENRWYAVDEEGKSYQVIRPEESPEQEALVEQLFAERERVSAAREKASEVPAVETEAMTEQRARKLMERYAQFGDPEAVFKDITESQGVEPTWAEYADALEAELKPLVAKPFEEREAMIEGATAERRGVSRAQLAKESEYHEQRRLALAMKEAQDTALSRKELAEEAAEKKRGGGKGAKFKGHAQVETRPVTLGFEERPARPQPSAGGGHHVVREAEGGPAGRPVSPAPPKDLELYNRAKENVRKEHDLPRDPVELLKLQEAEPDVTLTNQEIDKLVNREYHKLLRQKRAAQKAEEKPPEPPEEPPAAAAPAAKPKPPVPGRPGAPSVTEPLGGPRTPEQEAEIRQRMAEIEAEDQAILRAEREKEAGAAAPKPKTFKVRTRLDEFANSPETPVATEISNQGGLISKTEAQKQGIYEGNKALWDDVPKLAHPTHRKIYKPNGVRPDVMVQSLYDRGLIKEASVAAMREALEKESAHVRGKAKGAEEKMTGEAGAKEQVKQAERFGKGQREEREGDGITIPVKELRVGDKVKVDNTELRVTEVAPDGDVTLEDGRRYGVQEVNGEDVIYAEKPAKHPAISKEEAEVLAEAARGYEEITTPAEKFSTKKRFKKIADGRYEHKETKLIISKGKEGGWDIRHPATGEVIDNQPTRQKAMQAYAEGQTVSVAEQASKLRLKGNKEGGYTLNPIAELVDFGRRLYRKGMPYARWAKEMVKHLGKKIGGRLKEIWENLTGGKFRPGFREGGGMRSGPIPSGRGVQPEGQPEGIRTRRPAVRPGYGTPEEQVKPGYGPTGAEPRAPTQKVRPGYGTAAEQPEATVSDTRVAANKRLQRNPRRADQLIADLAAGKKTSVDAVDETILVQHKGVLQGARDKAGRDALNIKLSQEERAEAARVFADQDKQLQDLDAATQDGAVFRNKSQSKMWHAFKARDYQMPAMEQKLSVAKGNVPITEAERKHLQTYVDRLSGAMAKIQARKTVTGWRPGAPRDQQLRDLQFDAFQAKKELDNTIFKAQLASKGLYDRAFHKLWNYLAIPRAIMASTDLSAIRRQGGLLFMSHPIRALKIMPDMLRAMKSDRAYFELMQDIRERPNAELYVSSKLGLTEIGTPKLSELEEQYMAPFVEKWPFIGHSQRAYVYFLNRLRADTFDALASTLTPHGVPTATQAKAISNFINVFTGRGTIPGQYANSIALFNNLFFAPRYVLSRFQVLNGQPLRYALKTADPTVTRLLAKEYARTLIGYGVVYGIVGTALKEYADVEWDWRSTDFGKIKVGNTRVDIMSGLSQPTVLLGRSLTGETKTASGRVVSLGGGKGVPLTQRKYGQVVWDFTRTKFAPVPAAFFNVREGQTVVGEPTTLSGEALKFITPMSPSDVYKAMREYGLSKESALTLLTIFGDSVQTYSPKAQTRRRHKRHRSRER